ncbi:GntR family transcriptional regulator [Pseudonocardia acaciae]|uniref:GntR family transcriptional regulator n=1 Tax=Pseudonocardia acaciae TaxID=551276 RepID=UPI00146FDF48|nr:GntR family transcriptional regulator [Pseudonocardia acaciae]
MADKTGVRVDGRKTRGSRDESLVEHVRRLVLEDIIQARIKPGTMLQLTDLSNLYGVSRTPVREAMTLLERQGLVTAIAYKGYLVKGIEPGDVHDVYLLRKVIESAATEIAATKITDERLAELRDARPSEVATMNLDHDEYSHDFHGTIVAASGSKRLLAVFEDIYNDVRRIQYAGIGNPRPDLIYQEHLAIVEALTDRDGPRARRLMEQHIDAIRVRALESWLDER